MGTKAYEQNIPKAKLRLNPWFDQLITFSKIWGTNTQAFVTNKIAVFETIDSKLTIDMNVTM